jgi:parallel beta-helix repeat protein
MKRVGLIAGAILAGSIGMAEAKTFKIKPGPTAPTDLQAALIAAQPGDTVRIARGKYDFTAGLSLDVDRVTIRGEGMDKTILSFKNQRGSGEGLLVTSDDVTMRDFAVEDTPGDGIKSKDANRVRYYRVRVEWTRGPDPKNGAYGIYPVTSTDVLVEECVVRASADAGIYVGQSRNIIVRKNLAERNVAGIEIENSFNADVYKNVARENTGGVLVFDLPGLPQIGGHSTRIFRNTIVNNNTPNFASIGNIVASLPAGTGFIVMATRNVHVFENTFAENATANVIVTSYRPTITDANFNALPRDIVIRNNVFGRAGFNPDGDLKALTQLGMQGPDIFWDGATTFVAAGSPKTEPVRLSIANNTTQSGRALRFLNMGLPAASSDFVDAKPSTELPSALAIAEPAPIKLGRR